MRDIETPRLILHAIDESEARRICARAPAPEDNWAVDYPFAGDLIAVGSFLRGTAERGEQRPFGYYQIIPMALGVAVGGAGFKGLPHHGSIEIGYGLVPSARGHGYAAEAVRGLLAIATNHGLATVTADTTGDNVASQRTLTRAGFTCVSGDGDLLRYEISLAAL